MRYDSSNQVTIDLLNATGVAQAAREPLDFQTLAAELEQPEQSIIMQFEQLEAHGLALRSDDPSSPPLLLNAGRQYLARHGDVDGDALTFLPAHVDDLHARRALLDAGTVLIDAFRAEVLAGRGVAHA